LLFLNSSFNPLPSGTLGGAQPVAHGLIGLVLLMTLKLLKTILMMPCVADWPNLSR
jgi:hypothetical protein